MPAGMGILLVLNLISLILGIIGLVGLFSYSGGYVYGAASVNIVSMIILLGESILIIMWMASKDRAVDRLLLVRAMRIGMVGSILGVIYSIIILTNMPKNTGADGSQLAMSTVISAALNFLLYLWWHNSAVQFHQEKVKVERGA